MPKRNASSAPDGLNERERKFVELYMGTLRGNATKSYMTAFNNANARSSSVQGAKLIANPRIRRAIEERVKADPHVADRAELQRFFSKVAAGAGWYISLSMRDRLRAAELLGRSHKMFGDVLDVNVFDHEKYLAGDE